MSIPATIPSDLTRADVLRAMMTTEQCPGVTVFQHGWMVAFAYKEIVAELERAVRGQPRVAIRPHWKLPEWLYEHARFILAHLLPEEPVLEYHVWHDCGKPYCRTVDAEGRAHFPRHAEVSAEVFGAVSDRALVRELIALDMHPHLLRRENIDEFIALGRMFCCTLLLTAIAEVHANAHMFGGFDSDSFKIKLKRLDKLGRLVLDALTASDRPPTVSA